MLIATLDSRNTIQVGQNQACAVPSLDTEDEVVIDMRTESLNTPSTARPLRAENDVVTTGSEGSSKRNSSSLEGYDLLSFIHATT